MHATQWLVLGVLAIGGLSYRFILLLREFDVFHAFYLRFHHSKRIMLLSNLSILTGLLDRS